MTVTVKVTTTYIVLVLLILPWIATSTNEVGFHANPFFPSLAGASAARYPLQL